MPPSPEDLVHPEVVGGPGAPLEVNEDLLTTFNIGVVARGSVSETGHKGHDDQRYGVPRSRNMFRQGPGPGPWPAPPRTPVPAPWDLQPWDLQRVP